MTDPVRRLLVPDHVIDEVKRRVDIGAVVGRTVKLTRRGRDLVGLCPFHDEKTPSFNVSPNAGLFHCFGCRASGDVVAFVMRSTGRGFADALADLAAEAGVTLQGEGQGDRPLPAPSPRPAPRPTPEPQRPTPEAVGAAWDALCSRRTHESPAARWLDGRGIPARLAWSGFATLDTAAVRDLLASPSSPWLGRYIDAAIVAPIRSARTGAVVALQARAFTPAMPAEKRRTIGKLSDEDGTPRAYGRPDHVGAASLVLLVEGLVDTLAADVLASYADRVVIVGAVDAGGMPKIAAWIASHSTAPVVVVRHLDGVEKDGAGQASADEAVRLLGKRARHFAWGRVGEEPGFLRRLLALGVDASSHMKKGFDLGDALALAADEDVRISTVAASFLALVGAPLSQPGGSP